MDHDTSAPERVALCAPDKFSSSATAPEAAAAMALGAGRASWAAIELPLSDGGEGFASLFGGTELQEVVTGPLGEPVEASWWWVEDDPEGPLAVIETAAASGLVLAGGREHNDPLRATTTGTGELVATAVSRGAQRIVVGCGGSATTDGGIGALEVLGSKEALQGAELVAAYDTTITFLEAAARFAPQKGASAELVEQLTRRLVDLASRYEARFSLDVATIAGSGAAGGLAGGLAAIGARLVSGFDLVAGRAGLKDALGRADLVLTGEGRVDETSFLGKVLGRLLEEAKATPVLVVAGQVEPELRARPGLEVVSLSAAYGLHRALTDTVGLIEDVVAEALTARPG